MQSAFPIPKYILESQSDLYSMGLTRIQEHAKTAGATYKLVNTDIFDAYLEQYRIPGEYEGRITKDVSFRKARAKEH